MTAWPPQRLNAVTITLREWDAWFTGDREALETSMATYNQNLTPTMVTRWVRRWKKFWGTKPDDLLNLEPKIKVHVPLAADIARGSADLIFGEPPSITSDDEVTNEALQGFLEDGLIKKLAAAAEIAGAIGGVYLRAMWGHLDQPGPGLRDARRLRLRRSDLQFEELIKVTFWRVVALDGNIMWRHLEIHELDGQGIGLIRHQLWQGSMGDLGTQVPLTDLPAAENLAVLLDPEMGDGFSTLTPCLAVTHIRTVALNSLWRKDPVGANLGQPHIAGAEDMLDRLDALFSGLCREYDISGAFLTIPDYMLKFTGAGQGASVDLDNPIYTRLNVPPAASGGASIGPEIFQPDIRVQQFKEGMQEITELILRHAGFSAQTFGEDESGNAMTATEVDSKGSRSDRTRSRSLLEWQPGVKQHVQKLLAIGEAWNILPGVKPDTVEVVFPDGNEASPLMLAQTVLAMATAEAASIETKVRTLHPDWEDEQVTTEVALIKAEIGSLVPVPDPHTPPVDPNTGLPPVDPAADPNEPADPADSALAA